MRASSGPLERGAAAEVVEAVLEGGVVVDLESAVLLSLDPDEALLPSGIGGDMVRGVK